MRRILRHNDLDSAFLNHYLGMFESLQAHSHLNDNVWTIDPLDNPYRLKASDSGWQTEI